ncbi:MAG: STAS domain-containing protein [Zetaproteobacteria bacterium]|nr:STAS domain-containing protein [Zetaproteobacteria bacterium]
MKLDVKVEKTSDCEVWVRVKGDVNIQSSPVLRAKLKPLFEQKKGEIHIDLSGVSFMDSSGIATLVEGLQWARNTNGRFVLHDLQETVNDIFVLAKLDAVFEMVGSQA